MKHISAALLLAGVTALCHAQGTVSVLGQHPADAEHSEFFSFFNLKKLEDLADPAHPGMGVKMYGTAGAFKGAITLVLSTKLKDDTITTAALILRRDFIDNPATNRFARDAAKSFLELSPGIGSGELAQLHSEVWTGCGKKSASKAGVAPAPCDAGAVKSGGYLAFLGTTPKYRVARSNGYVMLQNAQMAGVPVLFVEMGGE